MELFEGPEERILFGGRQLEQDPVDIEDDRGGRTHRPAPPTPSRRRKSGFTKLVQYGQRCWRGEAFVNPGFRRDDEKRNGRSSLSIQSFSMRGVISISVGPSALRARAIAWARPLSESGFSAWHR